MLVVVVVDGCSFGGGACRVIVGVVWGEEQKEVHLRSQGSGFYAGCGPLQLGGWEMVSKVVTAEAGAGTGWHPPPPVPNLQGGRLDQTVTLGKRSKQGWSIEDGETSVREQRCLVFKVPTHLRRHRESRHQLIW